LSYLDVRIEAGQDPGGMIVIDEFSAELQIEPMLDPIDPLENRPGLLLRVLIVVKLPGSLILDIDM
jgi:hypothetical protein